VKLKVVKLLSVDFVGFETRKYKVRT